MYTSDSDCSSYQSGDIRKYEHHFCPRNEEQEKEDDLDSYIETLMEISCVECNTPKLFEKVIKDLRKEKTEIRHQVWEKNGELMVAERKEEILRDRIAELETEVEQLKAALEKKPPTNIDVEVETQVKITVGNN